MHGENSRSRRDGFRLFCVAAILAVAGSALTACDDENAGAPPDTFEYVALGDSFTATGLPKAERNDVASGRPELSAPRGQGPPRLHAGGRELRRRVDRGHGRIAGDSGGTVQRPQFDALDEGTDLVTVSLGGNDFDVYWGFLYRCVQVATVPDRKDAPCRTANDGRIERKMDKIRANIAEVLEETANRAPDARVLFVGYPRLLPDAGTCPKRIPVASGDVDYVREMWELLVAAQKGAAEDAGADYVDVFTPSKGHDVCSEDPWVNDVTDGPQGSYNFHPMPAHQKAVAELIEEML